MLIAALAPLLARFNLKIDLRAAPDDQVQLTLVPQKLEGSKFEGAVLAPIALTATATGDVRSTVSYESAIAPTTRPIWPLVFQGPCA